MTRVHTRSEANDAIITGNSGRTEGNRYDSSQLRIMILLNL